MVDENNNKFLIGFFLQLRNKVEECELLKKQHLEKFIAGAREDLVAWWDKCYVPQCERDLFFLFKERKQQIYNLISIHKSI